MSLSLFAYSRVLFKDFYLLSFIPSFPFLLDHSYQHKNISIKYQSLDPFFFQFPSHFFALYLANNLEIVLYTLFILSDNSCQPGTCLHHITLSAFVKGTSWHLWLRAMIMPHSLCYSANCQNVKPSITSSMKYFLHLVSGEPALDFLPSLLVSSSQSLVFSVSSPCPFNVRVPKAFS